MKKYECMLCDYQFGARSKAPERCPRCKSTMWIKAIGGYKVFFPGGIQYVGKEKW